ncbi:hypothetical protein PybrP1_009350 [[Pythium] brassicae (nom. inval.)]|nr:hypothetical protein PybrP1_009350 [[Pythium] brassicae (nom. inval.)]
MAPPAALKRACNLRAAYLALFFANAIFAAVVKAAGQDFGTFSQCDRQKQPSCMGNQLVFRASFSIAAFFFVRTVLSRFAPLPSHRHALHVLFAAEISIYVALLIGSFFIPSSFFRGYAQAARVLSGFFILFQIASIVDFSLCISLLIVTAVGAAFLYEYYGSCDVGVAFTTITIVASSSPDKSVVANAIIAAFAMTWTGWRTSNAASDMFAKQTPSRAGARLSPTEKQMTKSPTQREPHFSGAVVVSVDDSGPVQLPAPQPSSSTVDTEPWQFYFMMVLAGLYMAMVLTDWDSADGSSNGVSMWVKIAAQWLTILLFTWTLVAPKLFPDRDFS